eukprot:Rmarinus@m.19402
MELENVAHRPDSDIESDESQPLLDNILESTHGVSVTHVRSTWTQSVTTTFKAIVGAGIIALPYAFRQGGLATALVGTLAVYLISVYTMKQMIWSVQMMRSQRLINPSKIVDFTDICVSAFGPRMYIASFAMLFFCQISAVIAFLTFVAQNAAESLGFRKELVILVLFPVVLAMSLTSNTTYLAPTSYLGNISLVVAVVCVLWYGCANDPPSFSKVVWWNGWLGVCDFFGIAAFTFAAHTEIICIEHDSRDRKRYPTVIDVVMVLVSLLYLGFALVCYLCFGEDTHSIIFDNIGRGPVLTVVKLAMCVTVLFNYPLSFLPGVIAVESLLFDRTSKHFYLRRSVLRTVLVAFTCLMVILIRDFGPITTMSGGIGGIVCFVMPPLFYIVFARNEGHVRWDVYALNGIMLVLGAAGSVGSILSGFLDLIQ